MKRILRKKGFTLAEVIVAMAITAVLLAAVMSLFGPVSAVIGKMTVNSDVKLITKTIGGYYEQSFEYASDIQMFSYVSLSDVAIDTTQSDDLLDRIEKYCLNTADGGLGYLSSVYDHPQVMIVKYDTTNHSYYLYNVDLKKFMTSEGLTAASSSTEIQNAWANLMHTPLDLDDYSVFDEEFYGKYKYRFSFSVQKPDILQIDMTTYSADCEMPPVYSPEEVTNPDGSVTKKNTNYVDISEEEYNISKESSEISTFFTSNTRASVSPSRFDDTLVDSTDVVILYNQHTYTLTEAVEKAEPAPAGP